MKRSGFSLIELLIAISVVGLLAGLLALAIRPTLESARVAATRTTIAQIHDVVQQRIDAVNNADLSNDAKRLVQMTRHPVTNQPTINVRQAEFLLRKNLMRVALPQSLRDFDGLDRSPGGNDDQVPSQMQAGIEPGQVFFTALTQVSSARALAGTNVASRAVTLPILELDRLNKNHVVDGAFVDDWGNPLRFYLWPTGLLRPDGTEDIEAVNVDLARVLIAGIPSSGLDADPFDPTGTLAVAFSNPLPPSGTVVTAPFVPVNYHALNTYGLPLIVSAGPDGELGLGEPGETGIARLCVVVAPDAVFDNITNRQQ